MSRCKTIEIENVEIRKTEIIRPHKSSIKIDEPIFFDKIILIKDQPLIGLIKSENFDEKKPRYGDKDRHQIDKKVVEYVYQPSDGSYIVETLKAFYTIEKASKQ